MPKCSPSSSKSPFSSEYVALQVFADHPEGVRFFSPADADWHYANPAINAADPKTEQAALKSAQSREWRAAMDKELAAMEALGVFEWCFIPLGSNIITCKWLSATKWNADGSLNKYKARLVARGFAQVGRRRTTP